MITIHKNLSKYFRYIHVHFLRLFCAHQIAYNFPRNTFSNLIKYMYTTTCATSTGNIILIYHIASRVTCQNISPAVTRKPRCVVSMMKIHSEMLHTNILDDMYNSTIWVWVTLDPEICQYPFLAVKGDKTGRSFKWEYIPADVRFHSVYGMI